MSRSLAHEIYIPQRSKEDTKFKKMLMNFYSGIIPFVHVGKEVINKYVQCEVSTYDCLHGQDSTSKKIPKWLQFKTY